MRAFAAGEPFMDIEAEGDDRPVFCESFLYEKIGKEDARFVLAIADEYSKLIEYYGLKKIQEMLIKAREV